jgi:hypothetical protein
VDYESTRRVLAALESEGVRYVVFGAADYLCITSVEPASEFLDDLRI